MHARTGRLPLDICAPWTRRYAPGAPVPNRLPDLPLAGSLT